MIGGCIEISGPRMRAWVQIPLLTATFWIFLAFSGTCHELNNFQSLGRGRISKAAFCKCFLHHCRYKVAWPSGLRRWFKAPVSSEAWVRIPPLPEIFFTVQQYEWERWKRINGMPTRRLFSRDWDTLIKVNWLRSSWSVKAEIEMLKKYSGDTRIWTMDLSDCSRLLYHWAISPQCSLTETEKQVAVSSQLYALWQSHLVVKMWKSLKYLETPELYIWASAM